MSTPVHSSPKKASITGTPTRAPLLCVLKSHHAVWAPGLCYAERGGAAASVVSGVKGQQGKATGQRFSTDVWLTLPRLNAIQTDADGASSYTESPFLSAAELC